jgi:hypothetical protein
MRISNIIPEGEPFEYNTIPDGEEDMHMPFKNCQCNPRVRTKDGITFLFHMSADHRELIYGIEMMLGYRCKEHGHFIEHGTHNHVRILHRYYEYKHPKQ